MADLTSDSFNHKYVGARYVPKFTDGRYWNLSKTYEALTMVQIDDVENVGRLRYFISIRPVPDNIPITNTEYWAEIFAGFQGIQGIQGIQGEKGDAATIEVGTVVSVPNGEDPYVDNSGDQHNAVLDFGLETGPKGEKGDKGDKGDPGNPGTNYILTEDDKTEIADLVYNEIGSLDEVKF